MRSIWRENKGCLERNCRGEGLGLRGGERRRMIERKGGREKEGGKIGRGKQERVVKEGGACSRRKRLWRKTGRVVKEEGWVVEEEGACCENRGDKLWRKRGVRE